MNFISLFRVIRNLSAREKVLRRKKSHHEDKADVKKSTKGRNSFNIIKEEIGGIKDEETFCYFAIKYFPLPVHYFLDFAG